MKHSSGAFSLGIERGVDGFAAAWCLDMPGSYALIPPGTDPIERAGLAMLEFAAWSHNRAAEKLTIDHEHIVVAQSLDTGEDVRGGDSSAFFLHDGEPAAAREFPMWANAHDLALDELRDLAQSLPAAVMDHPLATGGRSILSVVVHAAATERWYAANLTGKDGRRGDGKPDPIRELQDAHRFLQEAVCDVAPGLRVKRDTSPRHPLEEWSVRKTMRRSVWHLRYHAAELRRAMSGLWLA